jgi:hypothetical protein
MAAIDFPNSPTLNQEFSAAGRTWKWNGTAWVTVANAGMTPTAHASSHASAGSDAVTVAQSQVTGLSTSLSDKASLTGTETLTNKTLTAPTIATANLTAAAQELVTVVGTGFAGYTYDAATQGVVYITANSTGNGTLNIRGNSGTTLNSYMSTGESMTVVLAITNNATAYYPTTYQIDGSAVTVKWAGGTAPTGGNANSIDVYTLTVIKTGSAAYTVLGSQTKFA